MRPEHDVRAFVSSLHQAVTSQQRYNIVNHLIQHYHKTLDPVGLSQSLVTAGFIQGLVLQLGFVLSSRPQDVDIICQALALVFRHCPEPIMEASVLDAPDLMPLLIRSLNLHHQHHHNGADKNNNNNQLLYATLSIWHSCSSSAKLSFFLLREDGMFALLPTMVQVLRQRLQQLRVDDQVELLGLFKNLSYYADDGQRSRMVQQPGLLPLLIHFSGQTIMEPLLDDNNNQDNDDKIGKIPERLSAVFRNLAVQPDTRQILSQKPEFVGALLRLATNVTHQQHHHHRQVVVLRNVLNTLQSLALEEESCLAIVLHGDGMVLDLLYQLLQSHKQDNHYLHQYHRNQDDDTTIRKRTTRIARLLCSSPNVVPMIVHHVALLEALLNCALEDTNRHVRMDATNAFCQCATVVQASRHPHFEHVLNGLAHLLLELGHNRTTFLEDVTLVDRPEELETVSLIARACRQQAANPCNRAALVHQRILLERLAGIAMPSSSWPLEFDLDQPLLPFRNASSVREDIVYTFYLLSMEVSIQADITSIPDVVKALVWNAQSPSAATTNPTIAAGATARIIPEEQRRKRDYAIASLVHLASNDVNRATLVSYSGLLPVLIQFAATAQQNHSQPTQQQETTSSSHANKASVKSTIMQLVAVL